MADGWRYYNGTPASVRENQITFPTPPTSHYPVPDLYPNNQCNAQRKMQEICTEIKLLGYNPSQNAANLTVRKARKEKDNAEHNGIKPALR